MKKQNVAQASKLEGFAQIFLFGVVVLQELANFVQLNPDVVGFHPLFIQLVSRQAIITTLS
jgi:hypothetical protein